MNSVPKVTNFAGSLTVTGDFYHKRLKTERIICLQ